jgi:hypothetical protein
MNIVGVIILAVLVTGCIVVGALLVLRLVSSPAAKVQVQNTTIKNTRIITFAASNTIPLTEVEYCPLRKECTGLPIMALTAINKTVSKEAER